MDSVICFLLVSEHPCVTPDVTPQKFTPDVLWDVGRGVRILIKKLITQLVWKPRDEFIKPN
jgi:hypothetical protein